MNEWIISQMKVFFQMVPRPKLDSHYILLFNDLEKNVMRKLSSQDVSKVLMYLRDNMKCSPLTMGGLWLSNSSQTIYPKLLKLSKVKV